MIKVYVAGAYSEDNVLGVLKNIGRGQSYAAALFQLGFAPFCPWHDKDFVIEHWNEHFEVKMFYDYSIEWLKVSDCLLVVPNHFGLKDWEHSHGTQMEMNEAHDRGIPIFYSLSDLLTFYAKDMGILDVQKTLSLLSFPKLTIQ